MSQTGSRVGRYAVAMFLGALLGGIFVARITAAPEKIVNAAMRGMFTRMRESGCNPQEM